MPWNRTLPLVETLANLAKLASELAKRDVQAMIDRAQAQFPPPPPPKDRETP